MTIRKSYDQIFLLKFLFTNIKSSILIYVEEAYDTAKELDVLG